MIGMQATLIAVLAVEGPSRRKTRRIRILQHRVTHLILIIFSPSFWQRKSILTEVFNPHNDCLAGILIIAPPAPGPFRRIRDRLLAVFGHAS